ncbi:MAG: beta-galactosidase [Nitrospiraceae bacterium]|nr:beta-galactosidase [Nitrospiraceae bacterium]
MNILFAVFLVLMISGCGSSSSAPADPASPEQPAGPIIKMGGVYALGTAVSGISDGVLSNPSVTGVSLRAHWDTIEAQKGIYDWSSLDTDISRAIQKGKKIMIRVIAGQFTPAWVYNEGAKPFNFTDNGVPATMPVPWDSVYLNNWTRFIQALAARYAQMPQVVTVQMTGPCDAGEMYLPNKTDEAFWQSLGYTDALLIGAWATVIDAYGAAFPSTAVGIDIAYPLSFGDKENVLDQILNYAYNRLGARLRVQGNWLAAKTNEVYPLYQVVKSFSARTDAGFQMLYSADLEPDRFGGTLRQGIDNGLAAGASYLEIYSTDIENPAHAADIQYADENLKLQEKY